MPDLHPNRLWAFCNAIKHQAATGPVCFGVVSARPLKCCWEEGSGNSSAGRKAGGKRQL